MRPPAFWEAGPDDPVARLLAPLGGLYGQFTARRMDRPGQRAPCPVVCIGNFTLGGAGKTPTALAVAGLLRRIGKAPAFLTRGYGGTLAGPVVVDPLTHAAAQTGDEPLLLANCAVTVVSRDRVAGARLCVENGADIVVMDDGLQNPSLMKDLALAVVDGGAGLGNGLPFPAGPLRVPLERQWRHVHGLVLIGDGEPGDQVAVEAAARNLPIHRARLVAETGSDFSERTVLAFAGIGRPKKFFQTLSETGARVVATRSFPDHHPYSPADLDDLDARAEALGAALVTTQKDLVRLPPAFAARVAALPVTLRFADEAALVAQLSAV